MSGNSGAAVWVDVLVFIDTDVRLTEASNFEYFIEIIKSTE